MTADQIVRAAIPGADDATVTHILWGRTPYPCARVTARSPSPAGGNVRNAAKGSNAAAANLVSSRGHKEGYSVMSMSECWLSCGSAQFVGQGCSWPGYARSGIHTTSKAAAAQDATAIAFRQPTHIPRTDKSTVLFDEQKTMHRVDIRHTTGDPVYVVLPQAQASRPATAALWGLA